MPFEIQRVARALGDVLSLTGGRTPSQLADEIRGSLDFLQFYGLQQQVFFSATDGVLTEGNAIALTVPMTQHWLLFNAHAAVTKTATMTALRANVSIGNATGAGFVCLASEELGPFGATETGTVRVPYNAPFPRVILPGQQIQAQLEILGTDASANVGITALVGVVG